MRYEAVNNNLQSNIQETLKACPRGIRKLRIRLTDRSQMTQEKPHINAEQSRNNKRVPYETAEQTANTD